MPRARFRPASYLCALLLALAPAAWAAETETLYLSGKGKDAPVKWDFMCSAGMKANAWSMSEASDETSSRASEPKRIIFVMLGSSERNFPTSACTSSSAWALRDARASAFCRCTRS